MKDTTVYIREKQKQTKGSRAELEADMYSTTVSILPAGRRRVKIGKGGGCSRDRGYRTTATYVLRNFYEVVTSDKSRV